MPNCSPQIRMVAGFVEVLERKELLVAGARFELTTFRLSVRRGILWRPALIFLPEPHQVGLTLRVPLFDLSLLSCLGGRCRRFPPASFPAGRLVHSRAFAQAQPGSPLPARSASWSWHRYSQAVVPAGRSFHALVSLTVFDGRLHRLRPGSFAVWIELPCDLLTALRVCLTHDVLNSARQIERRESLIQIPDWLGHVRD
jgi:hypothetical protein